MQRPCVKAVDCCERSCQPASENAAKIRLDPALDLGCHHCSLHLFPTSPISILYSFWVHIMHQHPFILLFHFFQTTRENQ